MLSKMVELIPPVMKWNDYNSVFEQAMILSLLQQGFWCELLYLAKLLIIINYYYF